MDTRTISKQRGLRMAMQVAALSVGAGAVTMALAAADTEAEAATPAPGAAVTTSDGHLAAPSAPNPVRVTGWSCWGAPVSRGPLAPPAQTDADFDALLAEVPT